MARASIINANNTDTIESIETAQINLEVLQEREQAKLKNESIHLGIYNGNFELPNNWIEWLNSLSHELFKNSSSVAEYALEEWSIDSFTNDPTIVSLICTAIMSLEKDFSIQRFIYSLPLFIESFKRSSHYPNPMLLQMYISILEIITVYEIQDQATLIISQDIVETLLQISPNNVQYVHVLSMVDDIVEKTNGKKYINWLLDYAELLISENSVDTRIRDKTLENLLTKIYDQKQWLEEYQLQFVLKLASLIGIQELFNEVNSTDNESIVNIWDNFKNKTIGIYTLSENAGRHAKEYLEEHIENVKVLLNHDKYATEALCHLAHASDYLVLVTHAAKHAATGEIQKILRQKGVDPLFPIGKGSSSIIAALLGES